MKPATKKLELEFFVSQDAMNFVDGLAPEKIFPDDMEYQRRIRAHRDAAWQALRLLRDDLETAFIRARNKEAL